eukprot:4101974-Pyramimonas_sp.AAC.1
MPRSRRRRRCCAPCAASRWRFRGGNGTHPPTFPSFSPVRASWEVLVATAGFASTPRSARTPGEVYGEQ